MRSTITKERLSEIRLISSEIGELLDYVDDLRKLVESVYDQNLESCECGGTRNENGEHEHDRDCWDANAAMLLNFALPQCHCWKNIKNRITNEFES